MLLPLNAGLTVRILAKSQTGVLSLIARYIDQNDRVQTSTFALATISADQSTSFSLPMSAKELLSFGVVGTLLVGDGAIWATVFLNQNLSGINVPLQFLAHGLVHDNPVMTWHDLGTIPESVLPPREFTINPASPAVGSPLIFTDTDADYLILGVRYQLTCSAAVANRYLRVMHASPAGATWAEYWDSTVVLAAAFRQATFCPSGSLISPTTSLGTVPFPVFELRAGEQLRLNPLNLDAGDAITGITLRLSVLPLIISP